MELMMNTFRRAAAVIIALAAASLPALVFAHGNHQPRHGGVIDSDRTTTLELVVRPDKVEVYVLYDEEAIESKGMKGTVKITPPGAAPKTYNLIAGGGNRLVANGAKAPKGSTAEVTITGGYDSPAIGFFRIK
jgi:hypothetical protein